MKESCDVQGVCLEERMKSTNCLYISNSDLISFRNGRFPNKKIVSAAVVLSLCVCVCVCVYIYIYHSLVFSLEGRAWQEPEPSHVTGMALAHCILGKFLGVVCHCFPPAFRRSHFSRQVPPSAMTREILAAKGGTVGEKDVTNLLPLRRKAC